MEGCKNQLDTLPDYDLTNFVHETDTDSLRAFISDLKCVAKDFEGVCRLLTNKYLKMGSPIESHNCTRVKRKYLHDVNTLIDALNQLLRKISGEGSVSKFDSDSTRSGFSLFFSISTRSK